MSQKTTVGNWYGKFKSCKERNPFKAYLFSTSNPGTTNPLPGEGELLWERVRRRFLPVAFGGVGAGAGAGAAASEEDEDGLGCCCSDMADHSLDGGSTHRTLKRQ